MITKEIRHRKGLVLFRQRNEARGDDKPRQTAKADENNSADAPHQPHIPAFAGSANKRVGAHERGIERQRHDPAAQRATSLALVANELLQNALEHGMAGRKEGNISINLGNRGTYLELKVSDDGHGLPPSFNPDADLNLGLDIVRTTVTEDLQGQFEIGPADPPPGALVRIALPLKVMTIS